MTGIRVLAGAAAIAALVMQPLTTFAGGPSNSANTETLTAPGMEVSHANIFKMNPCSTGNGFSCLQEGCDDNGWPLNPLQSTATYAAVHFADDDNYDCDIAVLFFDYYGDEVCRLNHNIEGGETWHVASQYLDPAVRKIHDHCENLNWTKGRISLYTQATSRCKDQMRVHFEVIKYGPAPMMMKRGYEKVSVHGQVCDASASAVDNPWIGYCRCDTYGVCRLQIPQISRASNKLEESRVNNNQHDDKQE